MSLSAFTVERYRSFVRPARVDLRPLTLLFGYNGAGKSALLRTLPLLSASTAVDSTGPLALGSLASRGASFADLHSQLDSSNFIHFGLEWDDDEFQTRRCELRIFHDLERREQVVERIKAYNAAGKLLLDATWDPDRPQAPAPTYVVQLNGGQLLTVGLEFVGLVPTRAQPHERVPNLDAAIDEIARRLGSLRTSVHWLGSIRELPERRSNYLGRPRTLQPSGLGAEAVLAYDKRGDGTLLRQVSTWYEKATHHALDVIEDGDTFSLVVSPLSGAPIRINLVDTGEGLGQVLPVIVLGQMALRGELGRGVTLAIEHPELHLHPAAERDLAAFFCGIAGSADSPRMLLETHSENFLLRVQLAIVRGELPSERVRVYWVRELEDGSSVADPISFDELARPVGDLWPPGVFSEDVEQARQLVLERRRRTNP